ncbi:MAG: PD40 domain-containing protein, partial [Acidobacteria bacterium]|nr:PD40 domain-containing protein [Acidobacteriota bacterium]
MRLFLRALLPVSLFTTLLLAAKTPVTMTDLLKIRRVTSVDLAPDGSYAIYGVQSVAGEAGAAPTADPPAGYNTHLYYINLNDPAAKPVQLTHGKRNDTGVAIRPDGKAMAFLRVDDGSSPAKSQIWLMPIGAPGEAVPLSKIEYGVSAMQWRRDGKALLATSSIPASKLDGKPHYSMDRPGRDWYDFDKKFANANPDGDRAAVRAWLEKNAAKDNPTTINRVNFLAEQGLAPQMTIAHLFRVDAETGEAVQLTRDFYSHGAASWSPDG